MKSKWIKLISMTAMLLVLVACDQTPASDENVNSQDTTAESTESVELVEKEVTFEEGTLLLNLEADEKAEAYAELDAIDIYTGETQAADAYSHITKIESEQAYAELLVSTNKAPVIVYLGYNECPFCKVFSPKINQLASELDVEIHYYNTTERGNDATFSNAMRLYNVETVPHAFIVDKAKAGSFVNHESSMEEIEAFLLEYVEKTQ